METVESGVQHFFNLYGDANAHFFIYSTRDNYQNNVNPGCYNNQCNDFVQVSSTYFPGMTVTPGTYGDSWSYSTDVYWYKDGNLGHWWLLAFDQQWIGYYPRATFSAIAQSASHIDFGGEVVDQGTSGYHTATDMGSGYFPGRDIRTPLG